MTQDRAPSPSAPPVHGACAAVHPLRAWRVARGLTLAQAARTVGTTRQVWHNWETGKRLPRPRYMARLRDVTQGELSADTFYASADRD